jgi:hypothetical protein
MAYYDASYRHGVRPPRLHHLALYLASQQVPNHLLPSQAHGVIERQEVDGGEEGVEETEGQHESVGNVRAPPVRWIKGFRV